MLGFKVIAAERATTETMDSTINVAVILLLVGYAFE
jgi:hypothetical protein